MGIADRHNSVLQSVRGGAGLSSGRRDEAFEGNSAAEGSRDYALAWMTMDRVVHDEVAG
jgi:hypothetical protein